MQTFSSEDLKTVEEIRNSYTREEENDLEKLRRLDEKVRRPATVAACSIGTFGTLVLGVGLCICLGAIGASSLFPLGVVLGAAGIAAMTAAYFIYGAVIKVRKKKYAENVLALSDKILNGGAKL